MENEEKGIYYATNAVRSLEDQDEITLKDTIELMTSPDYRERFVAEYVQTIIRRNGLYRMLIRYKAKVLDFEPKSDISVLEDQLYYMDNYIEQLHIRAEQEHIYLPPNIH